MLFNDMSLLFLILLGTALLLSIVSLITSRYPLLNVAVLLVCIALLVGR
jgi:hypothetical protein